MAQYFNIVRIESATESEASCHSSRFWEQIDIETLTPGSTCTIHGKELKVVSLDDNNMTLLFNGKRLSINRHWQVLGTPEIEETQRTSKSRYILFFGMSMDCLCEWSTEHLETLVAQMIENNDNGVIWKNIPLMRELIHEFKDVAPFRGSDINPIYKAHYIASLLKQDFVDKRETPRLFQSLCELYRIYTDFAIAEDFDDSINEYFDKDYTEAIDEWISKLAIIIDNPTSKPAVEQWNSLGSLLKCDAVQATAKWEDSIYDVEVEVEAELKDEPYGMGFCFRYWSAKRAAMAQRGIEWRSPASMNPRVLFD